MIVSLKTARTVDGGILSLLKTSDTEMGPSDSTMWTWSECSTSTLIIQWQASQPYV